MSYKAGFLGLIGQPNAGKSTLMNFLVDEKVSIVSSKPQTTRRRILGIWSTEKGQVIFVDAPGLIKADEGLNGFLAQEAHDVINSSDALLAIIAVDEEKPENAEKVIDLVSKSGKPWIAVITKTDIEEKAHRVMILRKMVEDKGGKAFSVSVKDSKNDQEEREALLIEFMELLPESPAPLYDTELFTNENVREMAAEIVREQCFEALHHEIPYSIAVRIVKFEEDAKPVPKIYAEIVVSKDSHKAIVIGKGASVIKQIGMEARKEIEKLMGEKIFLDLNVASKPEWFSNKRMMKELGYVVDSKD
ncbi:GTPase Era [Bdellovibrio bacteriovorus]|uniref:GTPase Era n=1 Tax=Bdellovibrio bacteriovorus (strain ATCC 15356 / DSM 50701 / NCIMB 9529 / HD100) TaxID=264462 RepID=Q6MLR4_BDEBA|nr:GTPase Era [Bdellovibrio bacteriovorus]AHZ84440.1 GTP-binding protein Era [Bdellovibrio bacteriovorus]BEV68329.1 GTPase Era [Bdellovibrio bacteriovorus]CAE79793.1 GTP-binding protein Era [Bdellovibrio bacteriovorus HD100]